MSKVYSPALQPNLGRHRGFTLFETMILTVILGVLLSVAFPAYQRYADRNRFTELMIMAEVYRTAIIEAAAAGEFASLDDIDEGQFGIPGQVSATAKDHGLHVHDGVIRGEWRKDGSSLERVRLELAADSHELPIEWALGGSCLTKGYC